MTYKMESCSRCGGSGFITSSYTGEPTHCSECNDGLVVARDKNGRFIKEDLYTYGHCEHNKHPKGCQLHNLHCGYPDCDQKLIEKELYNENS